MKNLLLMDLDGTLIDESCQLTATNLEIQGTIQNLIQEEWSIGLNSDTPLEPLKHWWYDRLAMNGPIVAELGSLVWFPDGREVVLSSTEPVFAEAKKQVIASLLSDPDITLLVGDATEFVYTTNKLHSCTSVLVALNNFRRCSLSFFVRRIAGGGLVKDLELLRSVVAGIEHLLPQDERFIWHFGRTYDIFIINAADCDKTNAIQAILASENFDRAVMLGNDEEMDFIEDARVETMAVANASDGLKLKATYVAKESHTKGVIEMLKHLQGGN